MLFKDHGSQYIEKLKMRDGWFIVKAIKLNSSLTDSNTNNKRDFYQEEV
jgi:hypothetical protein